MLLQRKRSSGGYKSYTKKAARCPRGSIHRVSYIRTTKRGKRVKVPAACIPDVGAPGKGFRNGPGIGALKEGNLTRYGYKKIAKTPQASRRASLKKAVNAYGSLKVWRKLNALSIYTRRTSPSTSRVAKKDMNWIRETWGLKAF